MSASKRRIVSNFLVLQDLRFVFLVMKVGKER